VSGRSFWEEFLGGVSGRSFWEEFLGVVSGWDVVSGWKQFFKWGSKMGGNL
jgi:hypothetical protein